MESTEAAYQRGHSATRSTCTVVACCMVVRLYVGFWVLRVAYRSNDAPSAVHTVISNL